ncbi:MAG: 1-acyl-sn-glycerol-3-phosphate acyltransferase [Anaerolineae bacterium]|nr:1-acyl-sn-glycerol-3-phosphate acyltransferase [Anaerolineae bacterium]
MPIIQWTINTTIKTLVRICCRVHDEALKQVSRQGPLIVIANHINFLETPLLYTHLLPRPMTAFSKAELWEKGWSRFLFTMWKAIPVHRGEADLNAMHLALDALERGFILALAPEGTRSYDGRLQRAHPGVVPLAMRSGALILPLAHWGGEKLSANLRRLRRTDFYIATGPAFYLNAPGKVSREARQQIVDEMMYQIAALLPPEYRGYYADLDKATTHYLRFEAATADR